MLYYNLNQVVLLYVQRYNLGCHTCSFLAVLMMLKTLEVRTDYIYNSFILIQTHQAGCKAYCDARRLNSCIVWHTRRLSIGAFDSCSLSRSDIISILFIYQFEVLLPPNLSIFRLCLVTLNSKSYNTQALQLGPRYSTSRRYILQIVLLSVHLKYSMSLKSISHGIKNKMLKTKAFFFYHS
jgi:hypothetical protein